MDEQRCRLVLISPLAPDPETFEAELAAAFAGGDIATLILALENDERKFWKRISDIARPQTIKAGAAFLIKDQISRISELDADGTHVEAGLEELSEITESLQPERIVGAGALFNRHTAMRAGETGVDYVLFGKINLEPEDRKAADVVKQLTEWWYPLFQVPSIAFASTIDDAEELARCGADFVAVGNAVWEHPDGVEATIRALNKTFDEIAAEA